MNNKTSVVLPGGIAGLAKKVQGEQKTKDENVSFKGKVDIENKDGGDEWMHFIEVAEEYKKKTGKLATVYIDSDVKRILERLKVSIGDGRLSASAILSSVVKTFISSHREEIEKAMQKENHLL